MTSSSRLKANQKNAQKSTGPRSIEGRKRSSKNALKHGLSKGQNFDADHAQKVEFLSRKLCEGRDDRCMEFAKELAQAQIQLNYIRSLKLACFQSDLTKSSKPDEAISNQNLKHVKEDRALCSNDQHIAENFLNDLEGLKSYSVPKDFADHLEARLSEIRKLGRYENIAMRRLKLAKERYLANNY
jgi:hypothetical protein